MPARIEGGTSIQAGEAAPLQFQSALDQSFFRSAKSRSPPPQGDLTRRRRNHALLLFKQNTNKNVDFVFMAGIMSIRD